MSPWTCSLKTFPVTFPSFLVFPTTVAVSIYSSFKCSLYWCSWYDDKLHTARHDGHDGHAGYASGHLIPEEHIYNPLHIFIITHQFCCSGSNAIYNVQTFILALNIHIQGLFLLTQQQSVCWYHCTRKICGLSICKLLFQGVDEVENLTWNEYWLTVEQIWNF